jgi:YidC/Oxa1 family membrane protein insertase
MTLTNSTWTGFGVQYFLAAVVPLPSPAPASLTTIDGLPIAQVDNPIAQGEAKFAVFMGPKDHEILVRAGLGLDRALDFGWFWFVAVPLLQGLKLLHALTGNWGIAIILLTTLVKVATIPLTQTTFKNMREMQRIQPQIQKLRERFKDDQVALQKETMELYRRHHVNPLSGCLPMVLQLPIFVGLYNALQYAIELRHAPFGFWINDLSAPDRLMVGGVGVPVLTILMGCSMFLQQWLTPQQGDPVQQRMMMIMPVIFTFMFINFPAGLVLYWLVNNILTIGQQYWMMRRAA